MAVAAIQRPHRTSLRAPVMCGLLFGGLQAASPLAFWWLPFCLVVDWTAAAIIAVEIIAGVHSTTSSANRISQMLNNGSPAHLDVAVIGAGQAGLAIGSLLGRQDRRFVILERADSIRAAWRTRWDSLVLFTPRRYDSLPGLAFPGDPNGYPTRDEVVAYLKQYASTFELPVQLDSTVRSLTKNGREFGLELDGHSIAADQVVIATAPFQTPRVPRFANQLAPDVFQTHSLDYRRPSDLPDGTVLVVGGGNTGYQIATELSATHHHHLAIGARQTPLPQKLAGLDLFWWLETTKLLNTPVDSRLGQKLSGRDTLIGTSPRTVKRHGVQIKPRTTDASERTISFADGTELSVDAVIWATGFGLDHTWVDLPVAIVKARSFTDAAWRPHWAGTSSARRGSTPGDRRCSWVKDDAQYLAQHISTYQRSLATRRPTMTPANDQSPQRSRTYPRATSRSSLSSQAVSYST